MTTSRAWGLSLVIIAAGAGAAVAQAPGVNLRDVFQRLDANGDMVIEKGEVPESARPGFERLLKAADTNKDGKVDAAEMRELMQKMPAGDPTARFKAMDKDGDGKVSKAEFTGQPAMFDRLDANRDGFIEQAEIKALTPAGKGAAGGFAPGARIMQMDKDGDGKVSKAEFTGQAAMFDRFDANNDGFLTKEEAAQAATVMLDRLRAMDTDGDGKISRDEFQGQPARFEQLDSNKDGFVTMEEIRDANAPAAKTGAAATPSPSAAAAKKARAKKKDPSN